MRRYTFLCAHRGEHTYVLRVSMRNTELRATPQTRTHSEAQTAVPAIKPREPVGTRKLATRLVRQTKSRVLETRLRRRRARERGCWLEFPAATEASFAKEYMYKEGEERVERSKKNKKK